ncbi:hypothetical protein KXJ75_11180 [Aeromonas sanarellii]|nr:hypothetical protein KXJ75_11180 [Aeromonas sanarellii]
MPVHPDRRRTRPNTDPTDVELKHCLAGQSRLRPDPGQPDRERRACRGGEGDEPGGRGEQGEGRDERDGGGRALPLAVRAAPELQPQAGHGGGDDGGLPAPVRRGVSPVALHRLGQVHHLGVPDRERLCQDVVRGGPPPPRRGVILGDINNDYEDYLGSGRALETNDSFRSAFLRYLYRVEGDWFVGGMAAYSNYEMQGQDPQSEQILEELGLEGFTSGA